MNIFVVGRGNVGGGLARRWERAGHTVTAVGRDGGNATHADVVVVAVPSGQIADALGKVRGVAGKVAIDTTNPYAGRKEAYPSLAHEVKVLVGARWPRRSTSTSWSLDGCGGPGGVHRSTLRLVGTTPGLMSVELSRP